MSQEIKIPDIGDFKDVPVIEVLVKPGQKIAVDDILVTLESDKATMDVPAPLSGVVREVKIKPGDTVSMGATILIMDVLSSGDAETASISAPTSSAPSSLSTPSSQPDTGEADIKAQILVLGAGPGGYSAAFRAADLGKAVVLVERWETLGGVCLNVGCIPSKALLHAAKVIDDAHAMADHGVSFGEKAIDVERLRNWKSAVVNKLTGGLAAMARLRKVTVIRGMGRFLTPHSLEVTDSKAKKTIITFEQAIIAAGSEPVSLPFVPKDDPRIIDSTGALALQDIPERLLVLGGGIIGLEMATVYRALGSKVTIVELMDQLMPGADKDIVAPLHKLVSKQYSNIYLGTKVTAIDAKPDGLHVSFQGGAAPASAVFDKVLVAVGRRPNGKVIGAENSGVIVDERGFIPVDKQMRTNVAHIFAIGDIVGQPMLAHKATHEAKVAAEAATGRKSYFDTKIIPSVAYTDPEVAWVGLTETEAKSKNITYEKAVFPWSASGRSLALGRDEGLTKLLFDPQSHRLLGCSIVGTNAGELIAEATLAIEMGADADDIALTIHPHPTLSETIGLSAEVFEGTITDLPQQKKSS